METKAQKTKTSFILTQISVIAKIWSKLLEIAKCLKRHVKKNTLERNLQNLINV